MSVWTAPQEVRDLSFRYALAVDTRDAAMLAAIFTADGVMGGWASREVRYAAPDGWARMIAEVDASFADTMHNVFNQTFERTGDGGIAGMTTGVASHLLPGGAGELFDFAMRYHDRYAIEDGCWKFSERRLQVMWVERRTVSKFSAELMARILKSS